MKRFLLLVSMVGAAVAGFLWWKRREVLRAESVTQDPWPSAVAETPVAASQPVIPAQPVTPVTNEPPIPKKPRKKTTRKVEADPTQ
jgi:hypothetical protein